MEASFRIRVDENGHVHWANLNEAMEFLKANKNKRMTVVFSPGVRTLDQNGKFHAIFQEMMARTGYPKAACKEYLKSLFIENGTGTSDMDVEEASEFIEFCECWMAEHFPRNRR